MRETIAKLFWAGVIGVALGFGAPAKSAEPSHLIDLGVSPDGKTQIMIAGDSLKAISTWPTIRILSAQVALIAVDGSSLMMTEDYFNCSDQTFAIMAAQEFTEKSISKLDKTEVPEWRPIGKGTVIEMVWKRICGETT